MLMKRLVPVASPRRASLGRLCERASIVRGLIPTRAVGLSSSSALPPPPPAAAPGVDADSIIAFLRKEWPQADPFQSSIVVHEVSARHVVVSQQVGPSSIRPGGYISGPQQFAIADMCMWFAVFGARGFCAMALTSELSIRFTRPALGTTLWARVDVNSAGRRSVASTATVWTDDEARPTAVAQGTYVLPPESREGGGRE